jgi:hypothetical protein
MATDKLSTFQVRYHVIALWELQFWAWNVRYSCDAFEAVRKYSTFHYCAAVWHYKYFWSEMLNNFVSCNLNTEYVSFLFICFGYAQLFVWEHRRSFGSLWLQSRVLPSQNMRLIVNEGWEKISIIKGFLLSYLKATIKYTSVLESWKFKFSCVCGTLYVRD